MRTKLIGIAAAAIAAGALGGAAPAQASRTCELVRAPGVTFKSPGAAFQYMRTDALPDTNPKSVVDAFPNDFANVGALIKSKCS